MSWLELESCLKKENEKKEKMREIDLNLVNHFVLQKQHLTERSKVDDIVRIVRDIGGLHATSPTAPYLSLLSRARNFRREQLDDELYVKRNLGKIRYVRKTVYILPKEMIPVAFAAMKKIVEPMSRQYCKYLGVTENEYRETSKRIIGILKGRGLTAKEIKKELGLTKNIFPIVNLMCDRGLLIRSAPKKGWKSNMHTYCLFNDFFPDINLRAVDGAKARELLVKQYLYSFGPVTENDAAWWTGFTRGEIRRILKVLQASITPIEIANIGRRYQMISLEEKNLRSIKHIKKHLVNFLPALDPYIMGYRDRDRYLDRENYSFVYDRSGNAASTIMLDGRITGVWDFVKGQASLIKIFLFKDVEAEVMRAIHFEAKKTGKFIAEREVQIKECSSMIPLTKRTAGGVLTPLKYC